MDLSFSSLGYNNNGICLHSSSTYSPFFQETIICDIFALTLAQQTGLGEKIRNLRMWKSG